MSSDRRADGKAFQRRGATWMKLLFRVMDKLHFAGVGNIPNVEDLSCLLWLSSMPSSRYSGASPRIHLKTSTKIF